MTHAALYGVLTPCLAALAFFQSKSPFDMNTLKDKARDVNAGGKLELGRRYNSDHAALVCAYTGWKKTSAE